MVAELPVGKIVRSIQGRDCGHYYVVVEKQNMQYVFLADGRHHHTKKLKRKNQRHLVVHTSENSVLRDVLENGLELTDADIRAALKHLSDA